MVVSTADIVSGDSEQSRQLLSEQKGSVGEHVRSKQKYKVFGRLTSLNI